MNAVSYQVTAVMPDSGTCAEYVEWLTSGHVQELLRCGASAACVMVLDGLPVRVQSRYVFPDRAHLDDYLAHHAPRLRAEGLARFPPERGISMTREIGAITWNSSVV